MRTAFLLSLLLLTPTAARADAPPEREAGPGQRAAGWMLERTRLSTLLFLHYGGGEEGGTGFNRFYVSRGYLTLKLRPVSWFRARATLDVYEDDDGWELRYKYIYGRFIAPVETAFVSEPLVEFGLVHVPWLSYEEEINRYRMQGTMFLERIGLFNSADLGITAGTLLGRKLSAEDQARSSKHFPGTWGSISLGLYNGGGYHGGGEFNKSKVFMSRLSVRPLGPWLPQLQLSYVMIHGKGNTAEAPDWDLHAAFASFDSPYVVVTGQLAAGHGHQKGERLRPDGASQALLGASGFAELRWLRVGAAAFGRYDWARWDTGAGDETTGRLITGLAYFFYGDCALVTDLDYLWRLDGDQPDDWEVKLTLQVALP